MSNYPQYLSFFTRSFSNVSKQNFLVEPAASGDLRSHRQMSFRLPSNANLHMAATRLIFALKTEDGTGTFGRLAAAKAVIDRLQIDCGGVSISSGVAQQAVLSMCLDNMKILSDDPVDSHAQFYRRTSGIDGRQLTVADGSTMVSEVYSSLQNTTYFAVELGPFFQSMQPNLFPLAVLPSIDVTIHLSGNATVVSSVGATTDPTAAVGGGTQCEYVLSNYRLLTCAYSIDDGIFDQVIATRLASSEGLQAIFCDYTGFSDTFTGGSTRVSSAASSLDKIIVAFRTAGFNGVKPAIGVKGYNADLAAGLSKDGVLDQPAVHGGAKFLNANLNFTVPVAAANLPSAGADKITGMPSISTSINSIRFPAFDSKLGLQSYELLKESFEVERTQSESLVEYLENRCMVATKLNLPQSGQLRARSGLNLMGSNSTILISAVGDTSTVDPTANVMVFLEQSCLLNVFAGKQVSVVR
jgi:hypothetical protein